MKFLIVVNSGGNVPIINLYRRNILHIDFLLLFLHYQKVYSILLDIQIGRSVASVWNSPLDENILESSDFQNYY